MKFNDFKLMGQDEHSFSIGHPKGKTIRVPKQGLSSLAHEKILKMAQGGSVVEDQTATVDGSQMPVSGAYQNFFDNQDQSTPNPAKNAMQTYTDWRALKDAPSDTISPEQQARLEAEDQVASGGQDRSPAGFWGDAGKLIRQSVSDVGDAVGRVTKPIGEAASDFASGLSGSTPGQAQVAPEKALPATNYNFGTQRQPAAPASGGMSMSGLGAGYNTMIQGGQEQIQGAQQEANALGQAGKEKAGVDEQHIQDVQAAQKDYQQQLGNLNNEYQSAMDDVQKGHIDPNHYYESKSTAGKVATAIGLVLGGIGGGLTGKENPALAFLNKQMDRDIESQKADLGKRETLLSANLRQFGNLHQATLMTQAMQAGIYTSQLDAAAAKSQDPIAKAHALQISGEVKNKIIGPAMQQLAQQNMMMNMMKLANSGQPGQVDRVLNVMRQYAPEKAKEIETRYIPSVGMASVPVPEKEREAIIKLNQFDNQLNDAIKFHKRVGGGLSALTPQNRSLGQGITNDLITSVNDLKNLNRFTGEEAHLYGDIVGSVGGLDVSGATAKKLQHLKNDLFNKKSVIYKQYGLPQPAQFNPSN